MFQNSLQGYVKFFFYWLLRFNVLIYWYANTLNYDRCGIIMVDIKNEMTDSLFKAILTLETVEECYKFFEDVCTVKEIKAIAQWLAVARMLKNKQLYSKIVSHTGATTATISRVNRSLMYGSEGYDIVFGRLEEKDK